MKITTWNVNGVRAREGQIFDWVRIERPDVVCLQETKASLDQVPVSLLELEGYWCYWHGHKGYSGVALHVSKERCPVRPVFSHPEFDHETRIVIVELGELRVASIYVPNGGKDFRAKMKFLEAMDRFVAETVAQGKKLVLCGDLNVARTPIDVHPTLASPDQIGQTPAERALIEKIFGHGLVDLGRHFAPNDDRLYTWWAPWRQHREKNIGWRLDYVVASEALAKRATSCKAYREFGTSDHGPVMATFEGELFDASAVVAGPAAKIVEAKPDAEPQLDLFGLPRGR
jgi:exodeoxyribonuclease-3